MKTARNATQLRERTEQELIKKHLSWSGSDEGKPSDDHGCVIGAYIDERLRLALDELGRETFEENMELLEAAARSEFGIVAKGADRKWEAAKVLLGIG